MFLAGDGLLLGDGDVGLGAVASLNARRREDIHARTAFKSLQSRFHLVHREPAVERSRFALSLQFAEPNRIQDILGKFNELSFQQNGADVSLARNIHHFRLHHHDDSFPWGTLPTTKRQRFSRGNRSGCIRDKDLYRLVSLVWTLRCALRGLRLRLCPGLFHLRAQSRNFTSQTQQLSVVGTQLFEFRTAALTLRPRSEE